VSEEASCASCEYFKATSHGRHGYCQRFPPVFTHRDDNSGHARFYSPVVSPNGWCGEYLEIEDEAKD
jgi:hypothetical protein